MFLLPWNITFCHSKLLLDNCKFHITKDERLTWKMEGKTNISRRLKRFDGLTWLSLTLSPYFTSDLRHWPPTFVCVQCAYWYSYAIKLHCQKLNNVPRPNSTKAGRALGCQSYRTISSLVHSSAVPTARLGISTPRVPHQLVIFRSSVLCSISNKMNLKYVFKTDELLYL